MKMIDKIKPKVGKLRLNALSWYSQTKKGAPQSPHSKRQAEPSKAPKWQQIKMCPSKVAEGDVNARMAGIQ